MKTTIPGISSCHPSKLLTSIVLVLFLFSIFSCHVTRRKRKSRARFYSARYVYCPSWGGTKAKSSVKIKSGSYSIPPPPGSPRGNTTTTTDLTSDAPVLPVAAAGVLTGGELNDFGKWELWEDISSSVLSKYSKNWKIKPQERYTLQVTNANAKPVVDCPVELLDNRGKVIWSAKTDNTGKAELWANIITDGTKQDVAASLRASYNGRDYTVDKAVKFQSGINHLTIEAECEAPNMLDVAFMVDATGSMGDEIAYLQAELSDIAGKITEEQKDLDLNLASIFYRCIGNSYTTKRSDFSSNIQKTTSFINEQSAGEGGTEAVEVALDEAVNTLKWRDNARARLLFLVLDEPPGYTPDIVDNLNASIKKAAEKGIRIIPIVASGTYSNDADKSLEYLMRSMALATNGRYVFITDHSGVGGDHTAPSTDEYDVELLNDLLVRLVHQFTFVPSCTETPEAPAQDTVYVFNKKVIEHVVMDSTLKPTHEAALAEILELDDVSSDTSLALIELEGVEPASGEMVNDEIDEEDDSEIPEEPSWKSFKLYPNPTAGILYAEIDGDLEEIYVADISGKLLKRIVVGDERKIKIDLSDLPSGMYVIQGMYADEWLSGKVLLIR